MDSTGQTAIRRAMQTAGLGVLPARVLLLLLLLMAGCATPRDADRADWLEWREQRHASLTAPTGWLALAGLHWLQEGPNPVGSHPTNSVVLPGTAIPAAVGVLERSGKLVRFSAAPGAEVKAEGVRVDHQELRSDAGQEPTRLEVGGISFWVLDRGDRMGVRVRDPASPARAGFKGLDFFPYRREWRKPGRFERYPEPGTLRVADVTGGMQELRAVGDLVFQAPQGPVRLLAVEEDADGDLFVLFRDKTAGESTYAAGRYLYVRRPGADGAVVIDFNRAYNPPCAFTPFATCPIPPRRNWLPFAVPAGERKTSVHP